MKKGEAKKLGLRDASSQKNFPSDTFTKIYANNVGLVATNWDMSLIFGEIMGVNSDGLPVVEQKVKVNMSREFIKALRNLITTHISEYEKRFGEIEMVDISDKPLIKKMKAKKD